MDSARLILRASVQAAILPCILAPILILSAGTADWPMAWALLSGYVGGIFFTNLWLAVRHTGLARERLEGPEKALPWDLRLTSPDFDNLAFLDFYRLLVEDAHRRGLRVLVESGPVFPDP